MTPIEIARKLAAYKQVPEAQKAYTLFLQQEDKDPKDELEAASYIFFSKGNYQVAYTSFVSLYNRGYFQQELMNLMTQAFYQPNVERLKRRYQENCDRLSRYPYLFRADFLPFEDLEIQFFPFGDEGYVPFLKKENRFGEYVNFNHPVIDRYFFKDLENPILAQDVYSQYQLNYLNDNVRKSEWVGRENHIYLHYTDWPIFCAYLQCLELRKLLKEEKLVFLIGEEIAQYPIDFRERFGIDYSQYAVKPIGIEEINRLIWHTQLAYHNGGDFFNEIFHGHPNLLAFESVLASSVKTEIKTYKSLWKKHQVYHTEGARQLAKIKNPTDKDYLIAFFMDQTEWKTRLDPSCRITPALLFQPHFVDTSSTLRYEEEGNACIVESEQSTIAQSMPIFRQFKYIKTFTPMRRPTTSHAATVRFMVNQALEAPDKPKIVADALTDRILNRHYMIDWQDRRYIDSVLVRFEDGKLNPKATFTALAEFLDLPYTQSMTYCSSEDGINPESLPGNAIGFDPAPVYRTYEEFADENERAFLEYFMRDVYQEYGYDFQYYHGEPVDEAWVDDKIDHFICQERYIEESTEKYIRYRMEKDNVPPEEQEERLENELRIRRSSRKLHQHHVASVLMRSLYFVNRNGQPLRFMKKLELDSSLLEQPLYH